MNKPNLKKALDESLKHWERMIRWADKQPLDTPVSQVEMKEDIGETWIGEDCSLCKIFEDSSNDMFCQSNRLGLICPLYTKFGVCGVSGGVSTNLWHTVSTSKTWGDWVVNAKKFYSQLESLK